MDGFRRFEEVAVGEAVIASRASVPERELLVWDDEAVKASLIRGLADIAEGKVKRLDHLTGG